MVVGWALAGGVSRAPGDNVSLLGGWCLRVPLCCCQADDHRARGPSRCLQRTFGLLAFVMLKAPKMEMEDLKTVFQNIRRIFRKKGRQGHHDLFWDDSGVQKRENPTRSKEACWLMARTGRIYGNRSLCSGTLPILVLLHAYGRSDEPSPMLWSCFRMVSMSFRNLGRETKPVSGSLPGHDRHAWRSVEVPLLRDVCATDFEAAEKGAAQDEASKSKQGAAEEAMAARRKRVICSLRRR